MKNQKKPRIIAKRRTGVTESINRQKEDKLRFIAPVTFLFAGLMPEYIGPIFTLVGFILVLTNRIKTRKKPVFGDMDGRFIAVVIVIHLIACRNRHLVTRFRRILFLH